MPELVPTLKAQVDALRRASPETQFILGGQGISGDVAKRLGATHVRHVEELVRMISNETLPKA